MEKNWAHSVDRCWLQALQFLVHHIDLLSMLLKCNDFTGIQQAVVDQTSNRPPNSDCDFFFGGGCKFGFGKCFGASSGHHQLSYKIHFSSIITIRSRNDSLWLRRVKEDNTSKQRFFLFSVSS
ncbi:unnamed protein product [Rangifer tarandus platyrhynchus]|uniref:Uncharacterized protein n=1 Tax=Rangifer tarandus platyrhynchus TaxID=3082113 RepID=A0AC59YAA4_RANTA